MMEEVAVPESGIAAPEPTAVTSTHPDVAKTKGDHQEQHHEDCDGINGRSAHNAGPQGEVVNDDREDDEPSAKPSQETTIAADESRNYKTPPDEAVKNVDNGEPSAEPQQDTSTTAAAAEARGKVSFGDVHIHKHRMTLGVNPSTDYGVPVELAWDQASSSELFTVDNYEEQQHSTSLHRLNRHKRQEIAQVNHSRESILKRELEVHEAQQSIERSNREWDQQQAREKLRRATSCCAIL